MTAFTVAVVVLSVVPGVWLMFMGALIAHHELTVKRWKRLTATGTDLKLLE